MWNLDTLRTLLRAVLKIGGGYLLARGFADDSTVEALIAGVLALVAVLWAIPNLTYLTALWMVAA